MKSAIIVGAGSFVGGVFRYLLSQIVQTKASNDFPFGTLCVNIIGCFFIGVLFGLFEKTNVAIEWQLFFTTGILGGFTTFSAFANESIFMFQHGQLLSGIAYIVSSVVLGLLVCYGGVSVVRVLN
jgi:CrcB protein